MSRPHKSTTCFAIWLQRWILLLTLSSMSMQLVAASDDASNDDNDTATTFFDSAKNINAGPSVAAILAIAAGTVLCFFGYKLMRPAMFACGFVLGGLLTAYVVEAIFKNESWVATASWIGFVVGGLIVGGLVITIYMIGIFVVGATGGVLLAFTLNTSFGYKIYSNNPDVILVVLAVILGLIGGYLAMKIERPVLIIATSIVGAYLAVWGIGYFAGDYPGVADLEHYGKQDINGDWVYSIPTAWWGYLAGMVVLAIGGMVVQFQKTSHEESKRYGPQRRAEPQDNAAEGTSVTQGAYQNNQTPMYGNPVSHV